MTEALIAEMKLRGITLWVEAGDLRYRASRGTLDEEIKERLRAAKPGLLHHLARAAAISGEAEQVETAYQPFPLTDVQASYLLGRRPGFGYGGHGCHGYAEITLPRIDLPRLERCWHRIIERHSMLRAVIFENGTQRVLEQVTPISIDHAIAPTEGQYQQQREGTRHILDHRTYDPATWPLFSVAVTTGPNESTMHFSIDFLIADYVSLMRILNDLGTQYDDEGAALPPLRHTFRDVVLAERSAQESPEREQSKLYWLERIDTLPHAPELPVRQPPSAAATRFTRHRTLLQPAQWDAIQNAARQVGVTPSTAVLTAFARTLAQFSRDPKFSINVTMMNRPPLFSDVDLIVGDFTTTLILAVDLSADPPAADAARALQSQVWSDLDHRSFSGVEVLRELSRRRTAAETLMPVVFTSAAGLTDGRGDSPLTAEPSYGISQTPQVYLDCQLFVDKGRASINWDVRDGVFLPGVLDAMLAAFRSDLSRFARPAPDWPSTPAVVLDRQLAVRAAVNGLPPAEPRLLGDGFVEAVQRHRGKIALVAHDETLTYGTLLGRAAAVAAAVQRSNSPIVAVSLEKGWRQIAAVLGVILAGRAYLPIEANQPTARRAQIVRGAKVQLALSDRATATSTWWPDDVELAVIDDLIGAPPTADPWPAGDNSPSASVDDLAYVMYTSGSTGQPNGVMITHRAAWNTITAVERCFGHDEQTVTLGLAGLGFDLSVWDIFGTLAAGGTLVLPDPARRGDPQHWAELIERHGVTLWNSVPAQLAMLRLYLSGAGAERPRLECLRTALLSGDWIPVSLPEEIRHLLPRLGMVSLGGATEASIWSVSFPIGAVPSEWRSIPYGTPLPGQTLHVLDRRMHDRPDWVTGDLWIGGAGLSTGYLGDPDLTTARYRPHPVTGERLYRTGDLARYRGEGVLEFLGREDSQVKIRGYRVELGEVAGALRDYVDVDDAVAVVGGADLLDRHINAAVVAARRTEHPRSDGATDLGAVATAAGQAALAGADLDAYGRFNRTLDRAALASMLAALKSLGLFADHRPVSAEEVLVTARTLPRFDRLLLRWLKALCSAGLLRQSGTLFELDSDDLELEQSWAEVFAQLPHVDYNPRLVEYFHDSARALRGILVGDIDPLQMLFPGGSVEISQSAYQDNLINRWANLAVAATVERIAAAYPDRPRLLEVGAGVGGTTRDVLQRVRTNSHYVFTDVSPFFLGRAERTFGVDGVTYAILDLNHDLNSQGFKPHSVDVVIAADVLHSVINVRETLQRIGEVLRAGGRLVFLEMTVDHFQILTSLELMLQLDTADGDFTDLRRGRNQTFLTVEQWQAELTAAGAEVECSLPEQSDPLARIGMHLFVARFGLDRADLAGAELREFAADRLPSYMVPEQVQVVDGLPVTANGKIDYRQIGSWFHRGAAAVSRARPANYSSDTARTLANTWAEILVRPAVSEQDGFLEAGGDSLTAAQVAAHVREVRPNPPEFDIILRHLLENGTVAGLAQLLDDVHGPTVQIDLAPPQRSVGTAPVSVSSLPSEGRGQPRGIVAVLPDATGFANDLAGALQEVAVGEHRWLALNLDDADRALHQPAHARSGWLAGHFTTAIEERLSDDQCDDALPELIVVGVGPWCVVAHELAVTWSERCGTVRRLIVSHGPCSVPDAAADMQDYLFTAWAGGDPSAIGYPAGRDVAALIQSDAWLEAVPELRPSAEELWRESSSTHDLPADAEARIALSAGLLRGWDGANVYLGEVELISGPQRQPLDVLTVDLDGRRERLYLGEVTAHTASAFDVGWTQLADLRELTALLSAPNVQ